MILAISIGIALLVPILFLLAIRRLDLFGTGRFYFNLATLAGGILAYFLAAQVNSGLISAGWVSRDHVIRITAPLLEEILKSLILIYLIQRADFNYIVDAAIYGFGAGIGFAIIENVEYVTGHSEIALIVAISRVFSTNLVHATGSGVIGTALAYRRSNASRQGWLAILLGYAFSISFHMGFNTMVSSGALIIFAFIVGGIGIGLIWFIIRRGLGVQKQWVAEKLGATDRVTKQETKMISTLDALNEVLAPIRSRFGNEKAEIIKELISKQAEIGIKRKLLEAAPGEKKKQEIEVVINDLARQMDTLRNQAGTYCMMYVRTVYLEQDIKVWGLIQDRIAESSTGQKGGGLWDRVNTRISDGAQSQENNS